MLFTIEPMINLGKPHVKILPDGWTAVTRDRELSAQFEHTVGVTETGCQVFTISPMGSSVPPIGWSELATGWVAMAAKGVAVQPVAGQGICQPPPSRSAVHCASGLRRSQARQTMAMH